MSNQDIKFDRRRFFKASVKYGFTAAAVAGVAGTLLSETALAQTASEDEARKANAQYTMTLGSAYALDASRSYPIMHVNFKDNIENFSNGAVYVQLAAGGELGADSALVEKVQIGTIQAAQHSLSNFAPFVPAVDLVNIPYWTGTNQQFINLVTSDAWKTNIDAQVEAKGFKPLWYVVIDPRVVALRRGQDGPIKTPSDLRGLKFRVPGSQILQQFYQLLGASPTPIDWGETPTALQQGVADALDPSVEALNIFGFKDILSWVTFNRAVPDAQVYSCNLEWFQGLPSEVQDAITQASEVTSQQNLAMVPAARAFSMNELTKAGVQFYVPTEAELEEWVAAAGHQLDAWSRTKEQLAGSIDVFEQLLEAANTQGKYTVNDV